MIWHQLGNSSEYENQDRSHILDKLSGTWKHNIALYDPVNIGSGNGFVPDWFR